MWTCPVLDLLCIHRFLGLVGMSIAWKETVAQTLAPTVLSGNSGLLGEFRIQSLMCPSKPDTARSTQLTSTGRFCSHQPGHPRQEFHILSAGASQTRALTTGSPVLYQLSYRAGLWGLLNAYKHLRCSWYGRCSMPQTSFVAQLCTRFINFWSAQFNCPHIRLTYSKCGPTSVLYSKGRMSLSILRRQKGLLDESE